MWRVVLAAALLILIIIAMFNTEDDVYVDILIFAGWIATLLLCGALSYNGL